MADPFCAHPVETISRPFFAAFGPLVSKSTFGGTGDDNFASGVAAFRAEIDHAVVGLDDIEVKDNMRFVGSGE